MRSLERDIGFGKPIFVSSRDSYDRGYQVNLPAPRPGSYAFHTSADPNSFVILDLQSRQSISRITIWNREDVGPAGAARAIPLVVELSNDGFSWTDVARVDQPFGGRLSDMPFVISFHHQQTARLIRIRSLNVSHFHLDYIQINQSNSSRYGFVSFEDRAGSPRAVFHSTHNAGLFSNVFTAYSDLVRLIDDGIEIDAVSYTHGMHAFKSHDYDPYSLYFRPQLANHRLPDALRDPYDVHGEYAGMPLAGLKEGVSRFFSLSTPVTFLVMSLITQLGLDLSRTIAVLYRGTDKSTELKIADVDRYISLTNELIELSYVDSIFLQTDQLQVRHAFIEQFNSRVHYVEDIPVTTGNAVLHSLDVFREKLSRERFAQLLIAACEICANARFLINHTGNVAAWTAIRRGHAQGMFQFDAEARLIRPR
jgi:hypothetical protein